MLDQLRALLGENILHRWDGGDRPGAQVVSTLLDDLNAAVSTESRSKRAKSTAELKRRSRPEAGTTAMVQANLMSSRVGANTAPAVPGCMVIDIAAPLLATRAAAVDKSINPKEDEHSEPQRSRVKSSAHFSGATSMINVPDVHFDAKMQKHFANALRILLGLLESEETGRTKEEVDEEEKAKDGEAQGTPGHAHSDPLTRDEELPETVHPKIGTTKPFSDVGLTSIPNAMIEPKSEHGAVAGAAAAHVVKGASAYLRDEVDKPSPGLHLACQDEQHNATSGQDLKEEIAVHPPMPFEGPPGPLAMPHEKRTATAGPASTLDVLAEFSGPSTNASENGGAGLLKTASERIKTPRVCLHDGFLSKNRACSSHVNFSSWIPNLPSSAYQPEYPHTSPQCPVGEHRHNCPEHAFSSAHAEGDGRASRSAARRASRCAVVSSVMSDLHEISPVSPVTILISSTLVAFVLQPEPWGPCDRRRAPWGISSLQSRTHGQNLIRTRGVDVHVWQPRALRRHLFRLSLGLSARGEGVARRLWANHRGPRNVAPEHRQPHQAALTRRLCRLPCSRTGSPSGMARGAAPHMKRGRMRRWMRAQSPRVSSMMKSLRS